MLNHDLDDITVSKYVFDTQQALNEDYLLSDLILAHSKHGILITDRDLKIKWVNRSFEKTTGYQLAEVIGESPSLLSSGRHSKSFYQEMWKTIKNTGLWEGEVWNKRKNGEIYPEWLSIVALRDDQDNLLCFAGMFVDLTDIKAAEKKIRQMAYIDTLTGLASRNYLHQHLSDTLKSVERNGSRLALMFIDLDGFKVINDSLGHNVGDQFLKIIANRLKSSIRSSDFISRLGGDEFCIMVENAHDEEAIAKVANSCLQALNQPLTLLNRTFSPTASIGISFFPDDTVSKTELFKFADSAMYEAKRNGKNRYMFYNREMTQQVEQRLELEQDLKSALKNDHFELYYQPKIDLKDGSMKGVEALIRWNHPRYGIVPPNQFIKIAEQMGIIREIGLWVMQEAGRQLKQWDEMGVHDLTMAVNIDSQHFSENDFAEKVDSLLKKSKIPPSRFEIEITESTARNIEEHINTSSALSAKGIPIAIDDFGTGYSSLGVLKKMNVNTLKIDKVFIDDLMLDKKTAVLLGGILNLADGLGFTTVIEGVETYEQVKVLMGLGCRLIQGYYFCKPLPAHEIPKMAARGFSNKISPISAL